MNTTDVVCLGSETESINVKREVFLLQSGGYLIFNHVQKYFEEQEIGGLCFNISYRQIPEDQTLTAKEYASLVDTFNAEFGNSFIGEK